MSTTNQRLATYGTLTIPGLTAYNVQTGIQDKDGTALIPNFVQIDEDCGLVIFGKYPNGTFDIFNPDPFEKTVVWRAHHLHSEEAEPIIQRTSITDIPASSLPECVLFGGFPLAIAYQLWSSEQNQDIPISPAYYSPDFNEVVTEQDVASPQESLTVSSGRIVFKRSGVYRVRADLQHLNTQELGNIVRLFMVRDPDGSPVIIVPSVVENPSTGLRRCSQFSCTLAIDASVAEALRTYEIRANSNAAGDSTGAGDRAAALEIVKVGEKRP